MVMGDLRQSPAQGSRSSPPSPPPSWAAFPSSLACDVIENRPFSHPGIPMGTPSPGATCGRTAS